VSGREEEVEEEEYEAGPVTVSSSGIRELQGDDYVDENWKKEFWGPFSPALSTTFYSDRDVEIAFLDFCSLREVARMTRPDFMQDAEFEKKMKQTELLFHSYVKRSVQGALLRILRTTITETRERVVRSEGKGRGFLSLFRR